PHQGLPFNAFLPLPRLQRSLGRAGKANVLLAAGAGSEEALEKALKGALTVDDLALRLVPTGEELTVESARFVLRDEAVEALEILAGELGAAHRSYLTYLANDVRGAGRSFPYSSVVALSGPAEDLVLPDGSPAPALAAGELLLNAWGAEQLGDPAVGTEVELDYFVVGDREELRTETAHFKLAGTVAMEGLGADPSLTPDFPGISDAEDISDWDPPFPVDLSRVRVEDEEYWDSYRAAPKVFVSAEDGRKLWRNRFGEVTGLRLRPRPGETVETLRAEAAAAAPRSVPLDPLGLRLLPVRAAGLAASQGATDFSQLFLAFSWFLIVSAVLLVALLFSLAVEQRAGEVGLLRALGFPEARVRRRLLAEGAAVSVLGAGAGLLGGVGYAAAMMVGLRTWWLPAVGSERLYLHVRGASLGIGFAVTLLVSLFAIALSLRRLRRVPAPALLAGSLEVPRRRRKGSLSLKLAGLAAVAAALLLAV
ncbi:MAG: ABC transporter permease, partial [Acidobacteria bacterium]|nr:ABC transporter permease [Acidobacteriota bacterium]